MRSGPTPPSWSELDLLCRRVAAGFTAEWNSAGARLAPGRPPVEDAFALHGPLVLYHYPEELADPERAPALPPHRYLGGSLRAEPDDPEVDAWLATAGRSST